MLRLAALTTLVLVIQTLVGVAETWFFGFLGTEALAGVALAFRAQLIQMMANGGIGGGVTSAITRALGAKRRENAEALIWHAVILAGAFGLPNTTGPVILHQCPRPPHTSACPFI
ncbi:MATE family efflux transporter [Azospirillum brasilense]|uniref:MATE family efflux transporter n=1 Tax=Azospirillum brasilense TaxID=192 RepID=UPI000E6795AE|nr:MATE family efflux transporter [Azospirillum brasilense]NUB26655.1 hypothetical protein [Azospirillum brasilense]NUB35957.1 hypothetical protein [Azospirillum brasilense]RIW08463.1 hypothetical protein D2T81_01800 [Azospirillum brasilense]